MLLIGSLWASNSYCWTAFDLSLGRRGSCSLHFKTRASSPVGLVHSTENIVGLWPSPPCSHHKGFSFLLSNQVTCQHRSPDCLQLCAIYHRLVWEKLRVAIQVGYVLHISSLLRREDVQKVAIKQICNAWGYCSDRISQCMDKCFGRCLSIWMQ